MTMGDIIAEPLELPPGKLNDDKEVGELLDMVGLDPSVMRRFPHEFSGGQRQRITA